MKKEDRPVYPPEAAFEHGMKEAGALLSARPYSTKGLSEKLAGRGFSPETVEAVTARLIELGLLDDGAYAELVARHYARRGYGPFRVEQELCRRGLSREDARTAARAVEPEEEQILRLLRQKLKGATDRASCQKAAAALMRRGYGFDIIRPAIARLTGESPEDEG